jgi:hypothetical protein
LTGWNTPGTALEARTAMPVLPWRKSTISPLCRSVATTPSGFGNFWMGRFLTFWLMKSCSASPFNTPRSGKVQSATMLSSIPRASFCRSKPPMPAA